MNMDLDEYEEDDGVEDPRDSLTPEDLDALAHSDLSDTERRLLRMLLAARERLAMVKGLPHEEPGVALLVTAAVAAAVSGRWDVFYIPEDRSEARRLIMAGEPPWESDSRKGGWAGCMTDATKPEDLPGLIHHGDYADPVALAQRVMDLEGRQAELIREVARALDASREATARATRLAGELAEAREWLAKQVAP